MNFDRIAPWYDGLEVVTAGRLTQRVRRASLMALAPCRRVLLPGEGTGRFLEVLLAANPVTDVTVVEPSPVMHRRMQKRLRNSGLDLGRVRFVSVRLQDWCDEEGDFDGVATHFFFNCFIPEQIDRLVAAISQRTVAGARWVNADFHLPSRGWRRLRARAVMALMYAFFRRATGLVARHLHPADAAMRANGFHLASELPFNCGLLRSVAWVRTPAGELNGGGRREARALAPVEAASCDSSPAGGPSQKKGRRTADP